MIAALISAFAAGTGLIVDKIILSRERVALRVYLPLAFAFVCGLTILLVPLLGRIDWQIALLPNTLFLLFLMVIMAIAWNVIFYQSIQREKMHQHEMITMLGPIITIILAAIFFPTEFDWRIFVLGLVASFAIIIARAEKKHFLLDEEAYNLFLAVVLMSAESIIIRELLFSFTPVALYALRTFFLAIFFMAYYTPRYRQVSAKHWWMIAGSSVMGVAAMIGQYYAFGSIGIIHTVLITLLAPVIVFLASWEVLHERIRARVVIASIVVVAAVATAMVL